MKKRIFIFVGVLALILIGGVIVAVAIGQRAPADNPVDTGKANTFPILKGTNLLLEQKTVPDDLAEGLKLILVAYDAEQQIFVDKWLKPLEALNDQYPQLSGYYVPLLPQDTRDAAVAILGGMILAAKSDEDRARTVVVFTDIDAFNNMVEIEGVKDVQLFLLDANNQIRWRGTGAYAYETLQSLEQSLAELTK